MLTVVVGLEGLTIVTVPALPAPKVQVPEPVAPMVTASVSKQSKVPGSTPALGLALIVTLPVGFDAQPVEDDVNVKLAVPANKAVTKPALVTLALEPSELVQVPPVAGESCVVLPTQTELEPVILTVGLALTLIVELAVPVQPTLLVTVTVYVDEGNAGVTVTVEVVALPALELHK